MKKNKRRLNKVIVFVFLELESFLVAFTLFKTLYTNIYQSILARVALWVSLMEQDTHTHTQCLSGASSMF